MSLKRQIYQKIPTNYIAGGDLERLDFFVKKKGKYVRTKPSTVARTLRDMSNGQEKDYPILKDDREGFIRYCRIAEQTPLF